MSRPSRSVYNVRNSNGDWCLVGDAILEDRVHLRISKNESNFYSKVLRRDYRDKGVNIPIRAELLDLLETATPEGKRISSEKGTYEVTLVGDLTMITYTPKGYKEKTMHLSKESIIKMKRVLALFDFFMRDDESLEKTIARFVYVLVPEEKFDSSTKSMYKQTGLTIPKLTAEDMEDPKMPELGPNDEEAVTLLNLCLGI